MANRGVTMRQCDIEQPTTTTTPLAIAAADLTMKEIAFFALLFIGFWASFEALPLNVDKGEAFPTKLMHTMMTKITETTKTTTVGCIIGLSARRRSVPDITIYLSYFYYILIIFRWFHPSL